MLSDENTPSLRWMNLDNWSLDREIVLCRVIDTPCEVAYSAWTSPDQFASWFGPDGFVSNVREMDVRPGSCAKFDMRASDGTIYTNRFAYLEVVPNQRLIMDHSSDEDDSPDRFRLTITFDQQDNGKTVVTLRQLHQSTDRRNQVISFGGIELGLQTLRKLDEYCQQISN